jgi:hypothetical protein
MPVLLTNGRTGGTLRKAVTRGSASVCPANDRKRRRAIIYPASALPQWRTTSPSRRTPLDQTGHLAVTSGAGESPTRAPSARCQTPPMANIRRADRACAQTVWFLRSDRRHEVSHPLPLCAQCSAFEFHPDQRGLRRIPPTRLPSRYVTPLPLAGQTPPTAEQSKRWNSQPAAFASRGRASGRGYLERGGQSGREMRRGRGSGGRRQIRVRVVV